MVPKKTQINLLSKLLHRDLGNKEHRTNVHLHHQIPYHLTIPATLRSRDDISHASFFNISPQSTEPFLPHDKMVHKALTVSHFLNQKLRWVTLGGQYDWTQKQYPSENPPFPADVGAFAHDLFPDLKAEAAIVNIYRPGDTLNLHRDVSENCDKGLISISIGCDGIFVVGMNAKDDDSQRSVVLRLRSGDAVFMSGDARFAWHGVPQILSNTCPEWLRSWPAQDGTESMGNDVKDTHELWRDWMASKRINLNIRQMND